MLQIFDILKAPPGATENLSRLPRFTWFYVIALGAGRVL